MSVVVDVRGLPAVLASLDALDGRQRQNLERRAVRAAANVFKPAIAAAARAHHGGAENVPGSFAKVKVKVTTHGGSSGRDVEAAVRPKSPLFNIFEPGAASHPIVPGQVGQNASRPSRATGTRARASGKRALGGPGGKGSWDAVGRKRGAAFFSTVAVRHPGFRARPLLPGVFASEVGKAEETVASIIFGHAGTGSGE